MTLAASESKRAEPRFRAFLAELTFAIGRSDSGSPDRWLVVVATANCR